MVVNMEPVKGVDVSEFNGKLDINALEESGVKFVIIRCGYGSDTTSQDDVQYLSNVEKCEKANMPYGVYLYSYAKTRQQAISEANHTLRLLKGTNPRYGVWYDVEDSVLPEGETLIDNCAAYCNMIEQAGYYCGIYASLYFLQYRLNSEKLDKYDKWVAHWADKVGYDKDFGIWQYTDSGVIGGRKFDMNLAYRDYPAITNGDETDMTKEEVAALARSEAQKVYDENEKKYPTIKSTPNWARDYILKVYEELELAGTSGFKGEDTQIDASETYVRVLRVLSEVIDKLTEEINQN